MIVTDAQGTEWVIAWDEPAGCTSRWHYNNAAEAVHWSTVRLLAAAREDDRTIADLTQRIAELPPKLRSEMCLDDIRARAGMYRAMAATQPRQVSESQPMLFGDAA